MWLPKYVPNFSAARNRSAQKGGERREKKKRNCGMGMPNQRREERGKKRIVAIAVPKQMEKREKKKIEQEGRERGNQVCRL